MTQDAINPAYYKRNGLECIDCIEAAVSGLSGVDAYLAGNVMKYLWRHQEKGKAEDLNKAHWYMGKLANRATNEKKQ